jgi:hypothetical protein
MDAKALIDFAIPMMVETAARLDAAPAIGGRGNR